jgi:Tfp pilus assembly protein PilE
MDKNIRNISNYLEKRNTKHQKSLYNIKNEKGITLIALIVMIVILVILTGITIKGLTGNRGIIDVTETAAIESKIVAYKEQIEHVVHTEIIAKSAIGEEATTMSIAERLQGEDWVASARVNPTATSTEGNITVVTKKEGFIFQVYYNALYGKVQIDYIGKTDDPNSEDINNKMPQVTARYDKKTKNIYVSAKMPQEANAIAKIVIFQEGDENRKVGEKLDGIKDNEEYPFEVSATGWYKVVATSNKGVSNYTWVRATVSADGLEVPLIEVAESGEVRNNWYGQDRKDVIVEIDTSNSTTAVTGIHYEIISSPVKEGTEEVQMQSEEFDTNETKIRLPGINTAGTTRILAYAKGENGVTSETGMLDIRYDSTPPVLNKVDLNGDKKENFEWFRSNVEVSVKKENITENNSGIDGYYYKRDGSSETYVRDITRVLDVSKNGTTKIELQIVDKAGNKSEWVSVDVNKDDQNPDKPTLSQIDQTINSIKVRAVGNDNESGISGYRFEIRPISGSNNDWSSPDNATITTDAGTCEYTFEGKDRGEYMARVFVLDKAGNENMSEATGVNTQLNYAPVFSRYSIRNSKN